MIEIRLSTPALGTGLWPAAWLRFTVVDIGVEYDMCQNPLTLNSTALQTPFYLLLNLAVDGNFTDAPVPDRVSAPLPATMYVDYVRAYEVDGKGTVILGTGIVPEVGKFGVFTDNTVVNNKQVAGSSTDIFV